MYNVTRPAAGLDKRKTALAAGALIMVGAGIGAAALLRDHASDASDQESLRQQRTATGAPDMTAMRDRMMDETTRTLGLSDAQVTAFRAAQEADMPKMREIMENKNVQFPQKMQKMEQMRQENDARLRALLTPEQQKKFARMQTDMEARMRSGGQGMPPMPGGFGLPR